MTGLVGVCAPFAMSRSLRPDLVRNGDGRAVDVTSGGDVQRETRKE